MAEDLVIETRGLAKTYGKREALVDLDLKVRRGEIVGFLGRNGAGKTTTIRLLFGLIRPTRGEVRLFGKRLEEDRLGLLARTGALIEGPAFYPFLSARANLLALAKATGAKAGRERVDECLDAVGLLDRGNDLYRGYSHGMKQRLGIAWAILGKPELAVLDEPLNGLDPPAVLLIRGVIRDLAAKHGTTVLLSSHLLHEVELGCDRVTIIERGRLIAEGSVEELIRPDREALEVECDELEAALATARGLPFVSSAKVEPSARDRRSSAPGAQVLLVELEHGKSAELNSALVASGRRVSALVPRRRTLEELFHDRLAETQRKASGGGS